jgi:hypothetical protein
MIRSLVVLAAAAVATLGLATTASAVKPERVPIVIDDFVLEGSCAFPVLLEVIANKEYITFFSDGRFHVTGKLFVRATNVDDPDQVVELNVSGPGFVSPVSERGAGRGLLLLRPGEAGGPGLLLVTGRVDIVRAEDGFISNLTVRGSTVDVCALLAS